MDITPALSESAKRITAYGAGEIRINGEVFITPIIVQETTVAEWQGAGIDEASLLQLVSQLSPVEILLIGSGVRGEFLPPALRQQLRAALDCGVEMMDTGAACRTYNVLLAEGRKVAAALLPV